MTVTPLFDRGTAIERRPLYLFNQVGDGNVSRATFGAIEHRATAKDAQPITENVQAFHRAMITTIKDEAMGIDKGCRPHPRWVAPGYGTGGRTGGTENTFRALLIACSLLWRLGDAR